MELTASVLSQGMFFLDNSYSVSQKCLSNHLEGLHYVLFVCLVFVCLDLFCVCVCVPEQLTPCQETSQKCLFFIFSPRYVFITNATVQPLGIHTLVTGAPQKISRHFLSPPMFH